MCFRQGQRENKFCHTVPAGYGNIFVMAFDDRFYQIQSQTNTVLVQTAGSVGLVKTVENIRKIIRWDRLAPVLYADIRFVFLLIQQDCKDRIFKRKLDGIS